MKFQKKNEEEAKLSLDNAFKSINYDEIKTEIENKFEKVKKEGDYSQIIAVFNEKGISKKIGRFIEGIDPNRYCQIVVNLVRQGNDSLITAISKYLPDSTKL